MSLSLLGGHRRESIAKSVGRYAQHCAQEGLLEGPRMGPKQRIFNKQLQSYRPSGTSNTSISPTKLIISCPFSPDSGGRHSVHKLD
jgi:hypothetical protein